MITKKQYIEYLVHTPINYTGTNLANHLENVSHDAISDYLSREKATARQIWELAKDIIIDDPKSYLIVDDSVQDKRYSRKIELVKNQYSGAEHGLVNGIGIVNLVHSDGSTFAPIDYRYHLNFSGKEKPLIWLKRFCSEREGSHCEKEGTI